MKSLICVTSIVVYLLCNWIDPNFALETPALADPPLPLLTPSSNSVSSSSSSLVVDDGTQVLPEHAHQQHGRDLIVGGRDAPAGRYPYYVRLDYMGRFGCGGSLIAHDFILTAAHCALDDDLSHVVATIGAISTLDDHPHAKRYQQQTHNKGIVQRPVLEIFRHPAYIDHMNDFALLRIKPVAHATPVRLNRKLSIPQPGDSVTAMGCGVLFFEGPVADVLQEVQLNVVRDGVCDDRYQGGIHHKSLICATGPIKDSCDGDSGGPLVIRGSSDDPHEDLQVGLVNFGIGCADKEYPGVYSVVSYASAWIDQVLCKYSNYPPDHCPTCRDNPGKFFVDWSNRYQSCSWLVEEVSRLPTYCHIDSRAWIHCPFTCHGCTYEDYEHIRKEPKKKHHHHYQEKSNDDDDSGDDDDQAGDDDDDRAVKSTHRRHAHSWLAGTMVDFNQGWSPMVGHVAAFIFIALLALVLAAVRLMGALPRSRRQVHSSLAPVSSASYQHDQDEHEVQDEQRPLWPAAPNNALGSYGGA